MSNLGSTANIRTRAQILNGVALRSTGAQSPQNVKEDQEFYFNMGEGDRSSHIFSDSFTKMEAKEELFPDALKNYLEGKRIADKRTEYAAILEDIKTISNAVNYSADKPIITTGSLKSRFLKNNRFVKDCRILRPVELLEVICMHRDEWRVKLPFFHSLTGRAEALVTSLKGEIKKIDTKIKAQREQIEKID